MIISHKHRAYRRKWGASSKNRFNGAYYYSIEIVQNIIPNIQTDRNWVTVNIPIYATDHSIVFIHNNLKPDRYNWLGLYKDLVLVCGLESTCDKVSHLGKAIYLPLSIDVKFVEQFRLPEDQRHGEAFVGRKSKRTMKGIHLPSGVDRIEGKERTQLLQEMAKYEKVYAVGRTAIEAKCLGCEVGYYDERFPDPDIWKVMDNSEAVKILQAKLDEIDGYDVGTIND